MATGNEYVIQVKANSPNLCKTMDETMSNKEPDDFHQTSERNKGRVEIRKISVYKVEECGGYVGWEDIKQVIKVESYRQDNNRRKKEKSPFETRYYITNRKVCNAEILGKNVRQHWCIENQFNYVKDVELNEDKCKIKDKKRAANLALIRSIMMSIYRLNHLKSIKYAIERYCNRISDILGLIEKVSIC